MQVVFVVVGQHVLVELLGQLRKFFRDLGEALLFFLWQVDTVLDKRAVGVIEEHLLLGGEVQLVAVVIHFLHPGEEFLIHRYPVRVAGYLRQDSHHRLLHLIRGAALVEVEEQLGDAVQLLARLVHRHDGIFKSGLLFLLDYGVYVGFGLLDSFTGRRHILLHLYLRERRRLMLCVPGF